MTADPTDPWSALIFKPGPQRRAPLAYNWHVLRTFYLEGISAGTVSAYTREEAAEAKAWNCIQVEIWEKEEEQERKMMQPVWDVEPSLQTKVAKKKKAAA